MRGEEIEREGDKIVRLYASCFLERNLFPSFTRAQEGTVIITLVLLRTIYAAS